jgi:hypothetical protein
MAARKKGGRPGRDEHPPPDGKVRQSQAVGAYGPGAMLDLVKDAVLVGGLEFWGKRGSQAFDEPRLRVRLSRQFPGLRAKDPFVPPPGGDDRHPTRASGIQVLEFPRWFVCQTPGCRALSRRGPGDKVSEGRYQHEHDDGPPGFYVPVRFVAACARGHMQDFPWNVFVRHEPSCQSHDLALIEGSTGDFAELDVLCKTCKRRRALIDATVPGAFGVCTGEQPWLARKDPEGCDQNLRLLVRTASSGYFAQVESSLDVPLPRTARWAVEEGWHILSAASPITLPAFRTIPDMAVLLRDFSDEDVLSARADKLAGREESSVGPRTAELMQFVAQPFEQTGEAAPPDRPFFARRITPKGGVPAGIERVVLAQRLREVRVQTGFTRFYATTPDLQGVVAPDAKAAPLGARVTWLPGVEVRGEGIFVQLDEAAVRKWEDEPAVKERIDTLARGHAAWEAASKALGRTVPGFHGGRFYLLHSLAHLLIQAVSLECGYSASAIRERVYCAPAHDPLPMAAILLSTGTTGSEGTLGGLLDEGRALRRHLGRAFDLGVLCSSDPVCAAHAPDRDPTERWLEGAACHGCLFIAEPSCEHFNKFLDRALVVPTLGHDGAAFFRERP